MMPQSSGSLAEKLRPGPTSPLTPTRNWNPPPTGWQAVPMLGVSYAEDPPAAVVLDRPVDPRTVIPRFIGGGMGSIAGFISQFVARPKCDVRMRECLEQAQAPTLLVLPEYDFIFPPEDVEWALSRKSAAVETVTVPGGHLSSHLVEPVTWRTTVLDFLDAHLRPGQPPLAAGRTVPGDPVKVLSYGMDGRRLTVELEEPLPEALEILAMGPRRNVLLTVENPRPRMTFKLPCLRARKMRPLFSVRVVPEGFRPTTGTKRMRIEPE